MQYILIFLLSFQLYAVTIKKTYYITDNDIYISTLLPDVKEDQKLFSIEPNKYTKKVKAKQLIKALHFYGYKDIQTESSYVHFVKKSPINFSDIQEKIKRYYKQHYKEIEISSVSIVPLGYIKSLPKSYTVLFKNNSYLLPEAIFSIKSSDNKQLFFNYKLKAKVSVYKARRKIQRNEEISSINSIKDSIILDKFRALPLQQIDKTHFQSKHNIKKDAIIKVRDLTTLTLIRRDNQLSITMNSNSFDITFTARALQDGKYGDNIKVKRQNGKVLIVKVIGKNRAVMK